MFAAVRTIFSWIFQAIVTTVVVELVMGYFRRARERAAAKQAPAQPTRTEEPQTRAEKDVKPATRTTRRTRKSRE
jgi:hypothetical protein